MKNLGNSIDTLSTFSCLDKYPEPRLGSYFFLFLARCLRRKYLFEQCKLLTYSYYSSPYSYSLKFCYNKYMRIVFTRHAEKKIKDLAKLSVYVKKSFIKSILTKPLHLDTKSDPPKKIVSGKFDKTRILRIVYREEDDIITVITFYPAKKGRYF